MTYTVNKEPDQGKVKWFSADKGYGFIIPDRQIGEDVFVHISAVRRSGLEALDKDQRVSFHIKDNKGRPVAVKLTVLPAAQEA